MSRGDEGRRPDDHALSALEDLSLPGGCYTGHGLQQLARLPKLRYLHIEREGLTAPMPPAEVDQVRAMLPRVIVG